MLSLLLLLSFSDPQVITVPIPEPQPCGYGENRPRTPGPQSNRRDLFELVLSQRLRPNDRARILAALRARFSGEATEAFVAIITAEPYDSDASVQVFGEIAGRYRESSDPDLQVLAARARYMLALAWRSRHVGSANDGSRLIVAETYRETEAGRRWSQLLDELVQDYGARGPDFDEFAAWAEYWRIIRDAADRQPRRLYHDARYLEPELTEIGADYRQRMQQLIDRYRPSPSERVHLTLARAMDAFARYDLGRAALIPLDREIIRLYREARDVELRAEVNGAYFRLIASLEEVDPAQLAAVRAEHVAWQAERYDLDCGDSESFVAG